MLFWRMSVFGPSNKPMIAYMTTVGTGSLYRGLVIVYTHQTNRMNTRIGLITNLNKRQAESLAHTRAMHRHCR